ncbi:MAG: type II toxin-antitoxin system RelE/ParE family toxin [Deltaproteobacteria bacterium]|nr:type II toxin-antitoxin system RelE/ParE family toxin [Deltaproteobacteria bacterium]MBI3076058.1 type II toxin-antitoxin system RelE/ParE family toxin [Deltaproteobacteria bacterium]
MTYRLIVRRQAKADIREAARRYEEQRPGLGRTFVRQIDALLDRVRVNPMQHQVVYREIRRAIPRRFPYGVFYRIDGLDVLVFGSFICIAIRPRGRIVSRGREAN